MWRPFVAAALVALAVGGCGAGKTKEALVLSAIDVPSETEAKPVALKRIVLKVPRRSVVGKYSAGLACIARSDLTLRGGRYNLDTTTFDDLFRQELEAANYVVVGNPDEIFEDVSAKEAAYFIGGLIREVEANTCDSVAGSVASAYLDIEWQVYNPLLKKLVFKHRTSGSHEVTDWIPAALDVALEEAFSIAVNNFLADKDFHSLVTGASEQTATFDPSSTVVDRGSALSD